MAPVYGLHCSHEQIPPSRLLAHAIEAEEAGFGAAMSSDHFSPWSERQGESGFSFAFLGAAMHATSVPWGLVCAPGQRYHPAIVAQAIATLAELAPGRLWVALGTGEASNEHITGERWPSKRERTARLRECVDVIRALLAGEVVDHDGLVRVDRAKLWTLPPEPPALVGAAVSEETARRCGGWADALVTVNQPRDALERILAAFRDGGGEGKPTYLQVHLSWAPDEEEALAIAHDQWRTNLFRPPLCWDLQTVEAFDEAARHVRPEDVRDGVLVSADTGRHAAWLAELAELGFAQIQLHHVGRDLSPFIDAFGTHVLPELAA
ncbi:MAG: TIGR03885 family FMN-dependent LLM class oxidoreductase [Solirubrobacteraceae bacterium]